MKIYENPAMMIKRFSEESVVTESSFSTNLSEAEKNIGTSAYKTSSYSELFD